MAGWQQGHSEVQRSCLGGRQRSKVKSEIYRSPSYFRFCCCGWFNCHGNGFVHGECIEEGPEALKEGVVVQQIAGDL